MRDSSSIHVTALLLLLSVSAGAQGSAENAPVPTVLRASWNPNPVVGRSLTLSVSFTSTSDNKLMDTSRFRTSHDRKLHFIAMGSDLDTFLHTHPSSQNSTAFIFANLAFPKGGDYLLAFDGALKEGPVANHKRQLVTGQPALSNFKVTGDSIMEVNAASLPIANSESFVSLASLLRNRTSLGKGQVYRAVLSGPTGSQCRLGQPLRFSWALSDATTGTPIRDLQLYLGAPMHLAVVSSDLGFVMHGHGEQLAKGGDASGNGHGSSTTTSSDGRAESHEGHGRKLLQVMMPNMAHSMNDHMGMSSAASPSISKMMPSEKAMPGTGSQPGMSGPFGPVLTTEVMLPKTGSYAFVGQLRRGSELILLPFYITCTGK